MGRERASAILWFQIVAVSVVGAVAVICFLVSLFVTTGAETLRTVSLVAAAVCALIGVSFAFTGRSR